MDSTDCSVVKFRASGVGNLLVGGNAITENQLARLAELEARQLDSTSKPLTAKMQQELDDLIAKRDGDFRFGATALSFIRSCWMENVYGYREPLVTNEMVKGIMCEGQALNVISRHVDGGTRFKNEEQFEDDHFTGTPDILLGFGFEDWVEDIKCSWSLRTFMETQKPDPIYYAQGQVYMAITGRTRFRLVHVLLETPFEILEEERKRFYFRFNCDEENPHYIEAIEKVNAMHGAVSKIPETQRIRCFEFDYNPEYIETLRLRVEQARKVYASLSIGDQYE